VWTTDAGKANCDKDLANGFNGFNQVKIYISAKAVGCSFLERNGANKVFAEKSHKEANRIEEKGNYHTNHIYHPYRWAELDDRCSGKSLSRILPFLLYIYLAPFLLVACQRFRFIWFFFFFVTALPFSFICRMCFLWTNKMQKMNRQFRVGFW
jgi:hypothetical protein